ncbi:MAG TPA: hypothetical protein PKA05_00455 [Roseiflexaceae bacterium]|nr:hypothetical protein [Roseiflexaceae bacterium]HMP38826.1 hypothetical protein [Roseiflexaceae bacterium]
MSIELYRTEARELLARLLADTETLERDELLDRYTDQMAELYTRHSHQLFSDIFEDARTRLDARLSPDPVRQTIATVQTTMQDVQSTVQDIWKNIWGP